MSIADQITKAWNNANATVDQYALKAKKAPKSSDLQGSLFETSQQPALPGHGGWNEEAHPRVAKGSQQAHGGQFTSKDSAGGSESTKPSDKPSFMTASQAVMAGRTHGDWSNEISKAFVDEKIDEDHPAYQNLKNVKLGDYFAAQKLAGKHAHNFNFPTVHGTVTGFNDDLTHAFLEKPGYRHEQMVNGLDDTAALAKHRLSKGKELRGSHFDDLRDRHPDAIGGGDALPGGKADGKPDSLFKPTLLEQGKKVESEHTDKPAIAKEIAKDHLSEDPNYYDKLKKMEQGPKSKPADRTALEVPKPAENSAAKSGDQMGLFGEVANVKPDKSEKTGFKPTLLDQAKQPPLFDTKGHKDQIMMFDDGITPEDRLLKHNDSDEYPFAGMSLDQAAELASRHGHDYEEAKRKINNRPSSWISVLKGWQLEEKANRNELTREKRNAKWKPSEIQAEILKIIGTGKKFHKTQDMLTYSKYRTAMQSLVNRGVIDRVDGASEIYYKLSPRMKAQDALSEDQKN